MKKIVIAGLIVLVTILLLSSVTMAQTIYIVKKGDCLSVIGKRLNVNWQEIAKTNGIENPWIIHPKQKLIIRGNKLKKPIVQKIRKWENVGGDSYKGTWQWAIDNFNLPDDVKYQVRENIKKNKKFKWFALENGQELKQVVFGKNEIWEKTICHWDKTKLYAAKDYGVGKYHVIKVLKCGNWAWYKSPVAKVKKPEFPLVPAFKSKPDFPLVPVFASQKESLVVHNNFDFYMGGGIYESVHDDAKGHYLWAKTRYRPFEFTFGDLHLRTGIFAFGAMGNGDDGDYNYRWEKWAIGPTAKLIGNHWDADVDAGIGRLYNKGGVDLYRSRQIDDIFLFSAHGNFYSRRDKGEKWFPKTELNFELTLPYNNHHRHSWDGDPLIPDPNDNRSFELSLTQGIYDFNLNKHLRLTPGFNLGFTHEYGQDDPNFLQFGPMSVLSWYNEDIISISVLNYKENLGGDGNQWNWLSGWVSLGGIYKAYKASQITEVTAEDLKI